MRSFKLLINGRLEDGDATMEVLNPATEEVLSACPRASKAQLDAAVAAAKEAFPAWSSAPLAERKRVLTGIADIVEKNASELAWLLTQEQGKPLADATGEILGVSAMFRHHSTLDLVVKVLEDSKDRRVEVHRKALGVVGAITPWNFPMALMALKVAPALLAGNTVVVKPAASTPLSALRFGELVRETAVPAGVINIITDANDLGEALTAHPDVRKISFTGSTATGKKVMAGAAGTLKRITLELGGNDAAIVLPDVSPKEVAPKLFQQAFKNNGQYCMAIKRLYVHEAIYDEICNELAAIAERTVIGNGLQQGTQIGPLHNKMQFEKIKELLVDAKKNGKVIAGGEVSDGPGYFVRPTIVRDIADGTRLVDEEQFGPVLPVIKFSDPEEALKCANASPYGLGGSVWSNDLAKACDLAGRMNTGTVWINKHAELRPNAPFGGAKQSGFGTELGEEGLEEFSQLQVINMAR